jgi:TctA family transporter
MGHAVGAKFNAGPDFKYLQTSAEQLTTDDSGKVMFFHVTAATGITVYLPPVAEAAGCSFNFVVKTNTTQTNYVVSEYTTDDTDVIVGNVNLGATTAATTGCTLVSFVASLDAIGDYVSIFSDGVKYWVSGSAQTAAAITLT